MIDHGDYYEIIDYQPIAWLNEYGELVIVNCPYIPKEFVDINE